MGRVWLLESKYVFIAGTGTYLLAVTDSNSVFVYVQQQGEVGRA